MRVVDAGNTTDFGGRLFPDLLVGYIILTAGLFRELVDRVL